MTQSRELQGSNGTVERSRGMAAENDALLSGAKPHTSYAGFQDSSSSLGYIVKNTSASGKNLYLRKVDHYITKAVQPWKFVVQTLSARDILAEFVGTFVLVVSGSSACLIFMIWLLFVKITTLLHCFGRIVSDALD